MAKPRPAILPFSTADGDVTALGRLVANSLQTRLFDRAVFELVERDRVDELLNERDISIPVAADYNIARSLGQIIGTDLILVGTLNEDMESYRAFARVLDIHSGEVLSVGESSIAKTQSTESQYPRIIRYSTETFDGAYRIEVSGVVLLDRAYDATSGPDVMVILEKNGSEVGRSSGPNDAVNPDVGLHLIVESLLSRTDVLRMILVDRDVFVDDVIGIANVSVDTLQAILAKLLLRTWTRLMDRRLAE